MTSNISLAYPNRIDECAITDSIPARWSTSLPLTNIKNKVLKKVARSAIGVRVANLTINLSYEAREIGALAVIAHNFTTNAKVSFIGYSGLDGTGTQRFNSGSMYRAYPIINPLDKGAIPFESRNWWLGTVEESQRKSYTALASYYPAENQMCRSIQIIIDDTPTISATSTTSTLLGVGSKTLQVGTGKTFYAGQSITIYNTGTMTNYLSGSITNYDAVTGYLTILVSKFGGTGSPSDWSIINGDNYLEIGRIFLGRSIEPKVNPAYGDLSQGYIDLTEMQRAGDNTKYFYIRPKMRTLSCTLKYLSQTEAFSSFYDAQREVGLSGELLYAYSKPEYIKDKDGYSINMTVDKNFYARTFLCNFSELSPIDNPYVNGFQTSLKLEEIV